MTPNPDNGKEQMEFREFRAFYQHAVILKSGEKMKCFELMGPDILSAKDSGSIYTLVEIAKVLELEERLLEANKWADTYQKKYELSYEKIARLESENKILREGLEKEAKWNKGSYSSERLLDVLDKADALREGR